MEWYLAISVGSVTRNEVAIEVLYADMHVEELESEFQVAFDGS